MLLLPLANFSFDALLVAPLIQGKLLEAPAPDPAGEDYEANFLVVAGNEIVAIASQSLGDAACSRTKSAVNQADMSIPPQDVATLFTLPCTLGKVSF
jgi:hypothetical protein